MRYDLVVIGNDPAGHDGAIAAAKLNQRVALVERSQIGPGGDGVPSTAILVQAFREAVSNLASLLRCDTLCVPDREKRPMTMQELKPQVACVVRREWDVAHGRLERNGIELYRGAAHFTGPHELSVQTDEGSTNLAADHFLLACGTQPARPPRIPFDGQRVFDSDEILLLDTIPRSLIVVGGGAVGLECAIVFATVGVHVTIVDGRERLLESCDCDIVGALLFHARSLGIVFRLGEEVIGVDHLPGDRVAVYLERGQRLVSDGVLYAAGRVGDTSELDLQAVGVGIDECGRLWCDESHRTWAPHIYGAGDVVGFPAQARMSQEAGRRAVCHAFGRPFPGGQHAACEHPKACDREAELRRVRSQAEHPPAAPRYL